jgi:hypothetical protein
MVLAEFRYVPRRMEFYNKLNGQAVNEDGQTFIDDVTEGDVWFFPPYVPFLANYMQHN